MRLGELRRGDYLVTPLLAVQRMELDDVVGSDVRLDRVAGTEIDGVTYANLYRVTATD